MRAVQMLLIALSTVLPTKATAQRSARVEPRGLCIWSAWLPSCKSFLVIESHARYRMTTSAGGQSRFYLTGELGWMRNVGRANAVGGSAFAGYDWDGEITRGGIKARFRRWLGPVQQVDLSVGAFLTSAGDGGVGVLAGIDYGLGDLLLATVEVDYAPGERDLGYDWACSPEDDPSECRLGRATSPTVFVGFAVGKGMAAVSYGIAGLLGLLAAGMQY